MVTKADTFSVRDIDTLVDVETVWHSSWASARSDKEVYFFAPSKKMHRAGLLKIYEAYTLKTMPKISLLSWLHDLSC